MVAGTAEGGNEGVEEGPHQVVLHDRPGPAVTAAAGVTIGLDMASPHRLQLDPAAVRLQYALVLPRSRPGSTGNEER